MKNKQESRYNKNKQNNRSRNKRKKRKWKGYGSVTFALFKTLGKPPSVMLVKVHAQPITKLRTNHTTTSQNLSRLIWMKLLTKGKKKIRKD